MPTFDVRRSTFVVRRSSFVVRRSSFVVRRSTRHTIRALGSTTSCRTAGSIADAPAVAMPR
ncbi:hypothetical protein AQ475_20260 [Burkholderia thailandensis]|nr:hypothetical protein AQ475_20260 [Burkholderia thailandensis]